MLGDAFRAVFSLPACLTLALPWLRTEPIGWMAAFLACWLRAEYTCIPFFTEALIALVAIPMATAKQFYAGVTVIPKVS